MAKLKDFTETDKESSPIHNDQTSKDNNVKTEKTSAHQSKTNKASIPTDSQNDNQFMNGIPNIIMMAPQEEHNKKGLPLIDLNTATKDMDETLYREEQLAQLTGILTQQKKPNALLIGDAGVGKTHIVEELARRIGSHIGYISKILPDYTIFELPINALVSGKGIVGQLEEELSIIIDFASDPDNRAILFIDEIHQLMDSKDPVNSKIASALKPALSRGDIHVIGATTTSEARTLMDDPAFARRFSRITVPELTNEQTKEVLLNLKDNFQKHHDVIIPDNLASRVVVIGDEYRAYGSHKPDTAITLLDRACADLTVHRQKIKEQAEKNNDTAMIEFIKKHPKPILDEKALIQSAKSLIFANTSDNNPVHALEKRLNKHIIAQDQAKETLIDYIKRRELNLFKQSKPESFLFAGVTGSGKTEIGKQLAKALFGTDDNLIYLNMTEYVDRPSLNRIKGSSTGFVGSDSKRELPFDSLESKPYQVIILDEFEKCHKSVQNFFMQALDQGEVKTERGNVIDFSRTIIIATTNAGTDQLSKSNIGFNKNKKTTPPTEHELTDALKKDFPIELLNRFNHLIGFHSISKDQYKDILVVKFNQIMEKIQTNRKDLTFTPCHIEQDYPKFIDGLADKSYNKELNGRPAEKCIQTFIEDTLIKFNNKTHIIFDEMGNLNHADSN